MKTMRYVYMYMYIISTLVSWRQFVQFSSNFESIFFRDDFCLLFMITYKQEYRLEDDEELEEEEDIDYEDDGDGRRRKGKGGRVRTNLTNFTKLCQFTPLSPPINYFIFLEGRNGRVAEALFLFSFSSKIIKKADMSICTCTWTLTFCIYAYVHVHI